jgi:hypothetical protein
MSEKEKQDDVRVEDRRRFDREGNTVDTPETAEPSPEPSVESAGAENRSESVEPEKMNFIAFLYSLVHTALIHLGDVEDPIRKGVSENLEGAQHMIETLELLQEKTKGNLDQLEQQYLEGALFDLRMRYMQKAKLIKW